MTSIFTKSQQRSSSKIVTASQALAEVKNGDMIAIGGFVGIGVPELLCRTLAEQFKANGLPRNLGLFFAAGQGDGKLRGLNHFEPEGLIGKVIGGHWGLVPALQKLAMENKITAYNLPMGIISTMFRDIAARKPRTISKVGLGTFVDPRHCGGRLNERTTEDIVECMSFDGEEYLAYKTHSLDIALLRGTTADPDGNITMEHEALTLESLAIAMAAKNCGGKVIVQVERVAAGGTLNPRQVKIPGVLVDYIVVAQEADHWQSFADRYNPSFSGETRVPVTEMVPLEMGVRKIIARRAAFELQSGDLANLGIGMPEGVARVATEEGILDQITLTAEPGIIGGHSCRRTQFRRCSECNRNYRSAIPV